jgi:hypothetical protein
VSLRPHPHFDDRGTLDWSTRWAEALERARAEGRILFVEFGREQCGNCRTLVQSVLPHPEVAPLLALRCVALASDCDDPEDEVLALAEHLPDATMLPFALFADADGRFLAGAEGAQTPKSFQALLARALAAVNAGR